MKKKWGFWEGFQWEKGEKEYYHRDTETQRQELERNKGILEGFLIWELLFEAVRSPDKSGLTGTKIIAMKIRAV